MELTLTLSTPAGRAVTLLSEVYPTLVAQHGDELSLNTPGGPLTSLSEILGALFKDSNEAILGANEAEKAEVKSWIGRIEAGIESDLKTLESQLVSRTYLVGTSVTAADLALFAALHPTLSKADRATLLSHPAITRHFDHIQHLPAVASALAKSSSFSPAVVPIDVQNVPSVVRVAEVKVKKPKAGEAVVAEKKEVVPEVAAEGAAVVGKKSKKEKKEGGEAAPKKAVAAPVEAASPAPWMVDLRVGTIIAVKLHPDADSLYVETIDVGEETPRTVVSGLVKYIPIEQMRGRTLITVCNLKPANMRGVKSFAMVLCASSKEGKDGGIEFVDPPAGSKPGDRVYFEGFESESALDILNPKKKIFETVQPGFTTLDTKEAAWISEDKKVHRIITEKGICTVPTFVGASLS